MSEAAIRAVLTEQVAAWNRGDLVGFMAQCTEDVAYVTAEGVIRGRDAVRQRYAARYPESAGMPRLTLTVLEVREAGNTAVVVASWDATIRGGHALLGFERHDGHWMLAWDATLTRQ